MTITITGFANSPDEGKGMARDMRVRWAMEELGLHYEVRLRTIEELKLPEHRARHPFGQIPAYEEGDLILFESGAIILHLAERYPGLLPAAPDTRARAMMWMFAALSTLEPPIIEFELASLFETDKSWQPEHLAMAEDRVRTRLKELSAALGNRDWLEQEFSAGDVMMVLVLKRVEESGFFEDYPDLAAYIARGVARPAYQRALVAERRDFERTKA